MNKLNLFLVISMIFIAFLLTAGCGGTPTAPPIEEDFINIISVNPDSGLVDGVDTDFTVVVEYNLFSYNQGILQICFNANVVDTWCTVCDSEFLVSKGSGTHEFNVTVKPRNWGSQGDFSVLPILDEIPWVSNSALASDSKMLIFIWYNFS